MASHPETLSAALALCGRGWHVLPLRPASKAPATGRGWHDASADPDRIRAWSWTGGVGIACAPSGLLVVDVDPRHGGDDALHDLERRLGALPATVSVRTGGGGAHHYFLMPDIATRGELAAGVELKRTGYVVAPSSIHPSGRRYEWDGHPQDVTVAELPPAWLAIAAAPVRAVSGLACRDDGDALARIPAATFVPVLTGRDLDRRGFVCCPFHAGGAERTPSLRAWPDAERGWFCFGCGRGGSIYQLAAMLRGYPLPLRDHWFCAVRDELLDVFEAHYARRAA